MDGNRFLIVLADDFGIGPATTTGILDLAAQGRVTGSVLLVNSPHAEEAVQAWRQRSQPMELGWHPCLTLDRPLLPAHRVPSLVNPKGQFHSLKGFLSRLFLHRLQISELRGELRAQYQRFLDLVGLPPPVVNAHHHLQVFSPIGELLKEILQDQQPRPYLRRVREPWRNLVQVSGARGKRLFLSVCGRMAARRLAQADFPGNDWLAGVADPQCVKDPDFLVRWLACIPGQIVELACHPGYRDLTLLGRESDAPDDQLERRPLEMKLLGEEGFLEACRKAGFRLTSPRELTQVRGARMPQAA